ncbi:MAG: PAS domain S-box protein [Chitinophagia bacterium]|nr:PAS domain S-box protein [Chitinophagia bacterium]
MSHHVLFNADKKVTRKKDTVLHLEPTRPAGTLPDAEVVRYKQIVEECEAIILTHDLNGKLLTVNSAALTNLGYTADDLNNVYLVSLVPEKFRSEYFDTYLNRLKKDNTSTGILQILTKYGKKKYWLYNNNIFNNGDEQPFAICFAQDITDRVDMEESLKMSNETFRSAFDYSGIGMALISPQGVILDANNAVCTFTGYNKNELLRLNFLDLTHPEDNQTDLNLLHKMLIKVINHYSIEKRYISKSKKILWALHTVSKVSHTDGTPKFFILQIVDITRKKELADELNWKNSELEATRSGLINKIRQLEELNYIIAHNLRGPANNIRMLVEMLKNRNSDNADTLKLELNEIIDFLDEGSSSLLGSLNTLMDVVQISMNRTIPYDECNARKIVEEIINQLNSIIYEKGADIRLNLKVEIIKYPKVFLESIFYNFISNALKYSSPARKPVIIISTYLVNDRVVISVKDNGLGINLEKYGNKLFKLNQVFHPGHDSKGVGLFITKAQIESFGGSIQVKSKENEGSEFIVTL